MRNGFTKIPNNILDLPLSMEAIYLYMWLSINADKNGQIVTSYRKIAALSGMSFQRVRTAMKMLLETQVVTQVVTQHSTQVATILTITFLRSCANTKKVANTSSNTSANTSSNTPRAYKNDILFNHSIEEDKEEKKPTTIVVGKEKPDVAVATTLSTGLSIEERQVRFYDTLRPYVSKYSAEMLRAFYDYWSEPNRSMTKMRMELEKTWSLSMRLATWHKRDEEHKFKNGKYHRTDSTAETVDAAAAAVAELIAANR